VEAAAGRTAGELGAPGMQTMNGFGALIRRSTREHVAAVPSSRGLHEIIRGVLFTSPS